MTQPPRFEGTEEISQFDRGGMNFPLIIRKTSQEAVWDGILLLARLGQQAQ